MKISGIFVQMLFFLFCCVCICSCNTAPNPPRIERGVIDLSNWDFETDGPLDLHGDVEFYWNRLLQPDDFKTGNEPVKTGYIKLQSTWDDYKINNTTIGAKGYGTFRFFIKMKPGQTQLALANKGMYSSTKLWINGQLVLTNGEPGINEESTLAQHIYKIESLFLEEHNWEVVFQVANHNAPQGGPRYTFTLGKEKKLWQDIISYISWNLILLGSFLIMGLYHLGIYFFRRKDRSSLYFSLGCILWTVNQWVSTLNFYLVFPWYPEISRAFFVRLDYISYFLSVPLLILFIHSLYKKDKIKYITPFVLIVTAIFCLFILFFPHKDLRTIWNVFNYVAVSSFTYVLIILIKVVIKKNKDALLLLAGIFFLFLSAFNDMAMGGRKLIPFLSAYHGILGIILGQSLTLALRFSQSFRKVEKLSDELNQKNISLSKIDKLKDDFLANTSHELKTPLNGIIGIAETLLDGAAGPPSLPLKSNLSLIISSSKRLNNLVNDILDLSRLKNDDIRMFRRAVDLHSLVEVVYKILYPLINEKPVKFINRLAKDTPYVYGDENRIQQILHNLIGNAIKFTEKGEISISGKVFKNDIIEIQISDTGIGIPEEKFDSIFNSFEQIDSSDTRRYAGTGLGLSITRKLIELHGGSIRVESKEAQGSQFYFTLPLYKMNLQANPGIKPAGEKAPFVSGPETGILPAINFASVHTDEKKCSYLGSDISILAVDDEPVNMQVLNNIFSSLDIKIKKAYNGTQAIEIIESKEKPDIILLDVMMPGMNGYEVCQLVREYYPANELPVIMLTVKDQVKDLVDALDSGANDYISKPFSKNELLSRIKLHLNLSEYSRKQNFMIIGQMASEIIHDLSTPINAIKMISKIAKENEAANKHQLKYLQIIENEVNKLSHMAHDILNYINRENPLKKKTTDLNSFFKEISNYLDTDFNRYSVSFKYILNHNKKVFIDPDQFRRVVINIARNAIEAMSQNPPGNPVLFTVTVDKKKDKILFTFTDTGPGISPRIQGKLFEPFITLGKRNGIGLGLTIIKRIVIQHEGEISFETSEKGTRFFITIPEAVPKAGSD